MDASPIVDSDSSPFDVSVALDAGRFRSVLHGAGYEEKNLALLFPGERPDRPFDRAALDERIREDTPRNTLVRLFTIGEAVPEDSARSVLGAEVLGELLAAGYLRHEGGGVRARAALVPVDGLWMARDFWPFLMSGTVAGNYVPGVAPPSRALANLTVRRQGERVLDLGTGSGYQSLLAARHAAAVIGTDVNERALNFAAFNARLNGFDAIDVRQGSLYEAVREGEAFDLIVSNPPYVISPERSYAYRDSGMQGDTVCERVIRGAPARLSEGGWAVFLAQWGHTTPEDWADRARAWVADNGCDVWILLSETQDPISHASGWIRETEGKATLEERERQMKRWLAYFEELGIRHVSRGAVILRRRKARENWIRIEIAPFGGASGACGAQIQRIFDGQDFLEKTPDDAQLLDARLALAPTHEMTRRLTARGGEWVAHESLLRQTDGFAFAGSLDRVMERLLAACDGRQPVRRIIADTARALRADRAAIERGAPAVLRRLIASGFLTCRTCPADRPSSPPSRLSGHGVSGSTGTSSRS